MFALALKEFEEILEVSDPQKLSKREQEILYSAAYGMYEVGDYETSAKLFTKLVLHDPYELRFWKGLAGCRQMQRQYKDALHAWAIVCLLSGHSPTAHFHAAECYLSLDDLKEAKKALLCAELHLKDEDPITKRVKQLKLRIENG